MRCRLLLALAALASMTTGAFAAIPVRVDGSDLWTFDALPPAAEWSTRSIGLASGDYSGPSAAMALDAAVQIVAASDITNVVSSNSGNPPGTAATAVWSSSGRYLQTRAGANGATLLMVTLSNAAAVDFWAFDVQYDLANPITPFGEEVAGHRIYYSMSGSPTSWVALTNVSVVGPQTFTLDFHGGV